MKTPIEMVLCEDKYFRYFDQKKVNNYGINNYLCPKEKDYFVAGNYYADVFEYIEIKVFKCQNSTKSAVVCED